MTGVKLFVCEAESLIFTHCGYVQLNNSEDFSDLSSIRNPSQFIKLMYSEWMCHFYILMIIPSLFIQ